MECIKKRVCLEDFKSRIPSLIETIDVEGITTTSTDGSWDKIPKMIHMFGQYDAMRYGTVMNFYYSLLSVITKAEIFEYDKLGDKWIELNYDWRDIINNHISHPVTFVASKPTDNLKDEMLIGLVTAADVVLFYQTMRDIFGESIDGFAFIDEVHSMLGKYVTPSECIGAHVPYFVYYTDVPDIIAFMEELKSKEDCCNRERYQEYGGDIFLSFLQDLKQPEDNRVYQKPTLDIPILLTSDYKDLGQYRIYDVEEIVEDDTESSIGAVSQIGDWDIELHDDYCEFCGGILTEGNHDNCKLKMVLTSGESKLKTLRKRKSSVDDSAKILPGIYVPGQAYLESPYQIGYVKNISVSDGVFYGDVIESMKEVATAIEVNATQYEIMKIKVNDENKIKEGGIDNPIEGLENINIVTTVTYGDSGKTFNQVEAFMNSDIGLKCNDIAKAMSRLLQSEYPDYYCYKQDYEITYDLTYGEEDEEGNIVTKKYNPPPFSDAIYVIFDKPKINITYALGARLRQENNKLVLDETSPFNVPDTQLDLWEGSGIWYFETYPLKKLCIEKFTINNIEKELRYDMIDFDSAETTYTFDGIDFPRKNYIICNDVRYRSESYHKFCTYNPVFRDERMLGVSSNTKEEYDVVIDRGASAAFEKHLQLSELKTWADLENYRNGMFLNK